MDSSCRPRLKKPHDKKVHACTLCSCCHHLNLYYLSIPCRARWFRKWIVKVVVQQVTLMNKVYTGVLSIEREREESERGRENIHTRIPNTQIKII